ncbi:DUF924 family protein [Sandaracinobacter neustonicus]|nr:DUF924 family protein [Sandaracinobacter neustonicus]
MTDAADVVAFWREAGPQAWFAKDDAFDDRFRAAFMQAHEAAVRGELADWEETPEGALALILLLDQFPRNCFRGSARMFASDMLAVAAADRAVARGDDLAIPETLRAFVYLPYEHAEDPALQQRCVELNRPLGGEWLRFAELHRDIIARFGRFPHRNTVLGRVSTPEEIAFLQTGGFAG